MFYVKFFYVMGKALSAELSCPCDRSCLVWTDPANQNGWSITFIPIFYGPTGISSGTSLHYYCDYYYYNLLL